MGFEIDDDARAELIESFDNMIYEFSGRQNNCTIYYGGNTKACNNCIVNPITGESTNRYKSGGPIPFSTGEICPVCQGSGKIVSDSQPDTIQVVIDWEPKPWINLAGSASLEQRVVRIPAGTVTTRGFSADISKVRSAEYIVLGNMNYRYKLVGDPITLGPITNNRYFFAVWEKIG